MNSNSRLGLALVGTLTTLTLPVAHAQVCGDPVICEPDEQGPFIQAPAADSTGEVPVPSSPLQLPLSVAKFDPAAAVALQGVSVDRILLKRVEISLAMEAVQFSYTFTNTASGPCVLDFDYVVNSRIAANATVGTPELLADQNFDNVSEVLQNGDSVSWTLADYPENQVPVVDCTATSNNLAAWIGPGAVSWQYQLDGERNDQGCTQGSAQFASTARGEVSVLYFYCVQDEPPPPPPVDCTCDASTLENCEGCTPGYWKNHLERWDDQGLDDFTNTVKYFHSFNQTMGVDQSFTGVPDSTTILEVISTGGGGLVALNRHTGAALASADTAINYAYAVAMVIALYQDAVGAIPGPETITSVHGLLEAANEAGCPLSNDWVPSGICTYCFTMPGDCPCGADFLAGGCKNSTGQGGVLSASGSSSWAADDLVLLASNLPPAVVTVWIMAPAATQTPLSDGNLCVANGHLKIIRFTPQLSSPGGLSVLGPGIVQTSIDHPVDVAEIFQGDTWHFQAYYRDPGSPCGGDSNLTNAAQVIFF